MENVLITGISSGIGHAAALELASGGYHVIGAGRSEERTLPVVEEIEGRGGSAEFLSLDLASLESVRSAANTFAASGRTVDILVNNAGVGGVRGTSQDGFEIHFGVNHLGHFMLTHHLRPTFRPGTRVVTVTSAAHFSADGIDYSTVRHRTRSLLGWKEYCVSKLANVLFSREFARRQADWPTYAVHPGTTDTAIFPAWLRPFIRRRLLTPQQGAETVNWCSAATEVADETGLYYRNKQSRPPSFVAQDVDLARDLWQRSEMWCGITSRA